jgi:hypothetical protein
MQNKYIGSTDERNDLAAERQGRMNHLPSLDQLKALQISVQNKKGGYFALLHTSVVRLQHCAVSSNTRAPLFPVRICIAQSLQVLSINTSQDFLQFTPLLFLLLLFLCPSWSRILQFLVCKRLRMSLQQQCLIVRLAVEKIKEMFLKPADVQIGVHQTNVNQTSALCLCVARSIRLAVLSE